MIRKGLLFLSIIVFGFAVFANMPEVPLRSGLDVFPADSNAAFVVCVHATGEPGFKWSAPLEINNIACQISVGFVALFTPGRLVCADIMPTHLGCTGLPGVMQIDGSHLPIGMKGKLLLLYTRDAHGTHENRVIVPDSKHVWRFAPP
jgi:hypothetical protein